MMMRWLFLFWAILVAVPATAADRPPDLVLDGTVRDSDRATTRDVPFEVPAGIAQVRVVFTFEGRDRGVAINLGVTDPQRFRGWGGGTKYAFTIGEAFATPSFLPGPVPAGRWRFALSVPSIRNGDSARWTVRIWFSRFADLDEVAFSATPLRSGAAWYRGDLHSHSGQSDARCRSLAAREAPCPPYLTFQEAADHGLDFIALTDHNVTSHFIDMGYLQSHFDTLLLLPGRELTTRDGHANLLGYMGFVETEVGRPGTPTVAAMMAAAHATGGFLTINHPSRPTGEDCLGCGWAPRDTDYPKVDAIEVVNGGSTIETPGDREAAIERQVRYWETLLDRGYRLIGVAGSDNHDAVQYRGNSPIGPQAPIGSIATVVHADTLSQGDILQSLKAGRAFVDLYEGRGRVLDISARRGTASAVMGGTLPPGRTPITGTIHVDGVTGATVDLIVDGRPFRLPSLARAVGAGPTDLSFSLPANAVRRWFRADVRRPDGRRWLIGNPVYIR